jgi:hypothetical protein
MAVGLLMYVSILRKIFSVEMYVSQALFIFWVQFVCFMTVIHKRIVFQMISDNKYVLNSEIRL